MKHIFLTIITVFALTVSAQAGIFGGKDGDNINTNNNVNVNLNANKNVNNNRNKAKANASARSQSKSSSRSKSQNNLSITEEGSNYISLQTPSCGNSVGGSNSQGALGFTFDSRNCNIRAETTMLHQMGYPAIALQHMQKIHRVRRTIEAYKAAQ